MQVCYEVDMDKCLSKFGKPGFSEKSKQKYEHVFVHDKAKNKYKDTTYRASWSCIFHYIFFFLVGKGKNFYNIYIYPVILF